MENRSLRSFNPVEKAFILTSLKKLKVEEDEIITKYLPLLEISPNKDNLESYLNILDLEEIWWKRLAIKKLSLDTAVVLEKW